VIIRNACVNIADGLFAQVYGFAIVRVLLGECMDDKHGAPSIYAIINVPTNNTATPVVDTLTAPLAAAGLAGLGLSP
jgi:hypothetical protein